MLKNYIKIGLRNLKRHRVHSVVNILGLSVGLAYFLLIFLFVKDELSYDRHIAESERIYRIVLDGTIAGNEIAIPSVPAPLAETMRSEIPAVENAVRMRGTTVGSDPVSLRIGDEYYEEDHVIYADPEILDFFNLQLLAGDPETVLREPNTILLTPALAEKYFKDQDPVGQRISILDMDREFLVSGIVREMPRNSHFHFDILVSLLSDENSRSTRWLGGGFFTYVKLRENASPDNINEGLDNIIEKYVAPQLQNFMGIPFERFLSEGGNYRYYIQSLEDIHLRSNLDTEWESNGNLMHVNILTIIGILILIIGGINFTNLSTSLSATRAKEIGMRKVMGSQKKQLVFQFVTESVLISLIALIIASVLIILLFDLFNQLANKEIGLTCVLTWSNISIILATTIFIGVLSGIYPAFYLSKFKPIQALSGDLIAGMGSRLFSNTLVVLQFVISTTLIIGTLFITKQLDYFQNKELGMNKENVIIVKHANLLTESSVVVEELLNNTDIHNAAFSSSVPGKRIGRAAYQPDDFAETFVFPVMAADENFLEVYGISLLEGRDFRENSANEALSILLNRMAADNIGWQDPVGKSFNAEMMGAMPLQVVGILGDFHFQSLHQPIQPLIIEYPRPDDKLSFLSVKISGDAENAIKIIREVWQKFVPGRVFQYEFFDQSYQSLYENDRRLGKLIRIFSVIAIFIACLGLFGLMFQNAKKSEKEIGIRKVLGSSAGGIVILFNKSLLILIFISVVIAIPLTYWIVAKWLENFAYRIQIVIWPFVLGVAFTFLIAVLSVSYVVIRAARTDPAIVLRND